jgi:hypothetical protein
MKGEDACIVVMVETCFAVVTKLGRVGVLIETRETEVVFV